MDARQSVSVLVQADGSINGDQSAVCKANIWPKNQTRGFMCAKKIDIDGKRYQCNINLFEVGSGNIPKPVAGAPVGKKK